MDVQTLKAKIETLDQKTHGALREALVAEYGRLTGKGEAIGSQNKKTRQDFAAMFQKAVDELNSRYAEGTIEYICKHQNHLYKQINEAEDGLNKVWKAGLRGKAGIAEFREALKKWYCLHIRCIEIFAKEHGNTQKPKQTS